MQIIKNRYFSNIPYLLGKYISKYSQSTTYITDLPIIGPLCATIVKEDGCIFVYLRSLIGHYEFQMEENKNVTDQMILMYYVDRYFKEVVPKYNDRITADDTFLNSIFTFFENIVHPQIPVNSGSLALKQILYSYITSNISDFKIDKIKEKFGKIHHLYVEEIDKFLLKDFLDLEIVHELYEEIGHFEDIKVLDSETDQLEIKKENAEMGLEIVIKEFITSELHTLASMDELYHSGVIFLKDKLPSYKYHEYFGNFEKIYELCFLFVKELIISFKCFIYPEVSNTLLELYNNTNNEIQYYDTFSNELVGVFIDILNRHSDYFNSYNAFVSTYEIVLSVEQLECINKEKLIDTFNIILQRLTKFSLLISRILGFMDCEDVNFKRLKIFLIKIKKFVEFLDKKQDIQYKKNRTWELCVRYNLNYHRGFYIDEIGFLEYKMILIGDNIIFINKNKELLGAVNVHDSSIIEYGAQSFFFLSREKVKIDPYYKYNLEKYSMYVLKIQCPGEKVRDEFIYNYRKIRKENKDIARRMEWEGATYSIPKMTLKDEEWSLLQCRFILDEMIKINGNMRFENFGDLEYNRIKKYFS